MDIEKEINGQKRVYCIPASQYIAGLVKKDIQSSYDIEVKFAGTGANLYKYSKKKIVNHYDSEHFYYVRSATPPAYIGGFYWDNCKDLAIFYKTNTDAENKILQDSGNLRIPYVVYKNLRDIDLIEIKGCDKNKYGEEMQFKYRVAKGYITSHGYYEANDDDMPWFYIPAVKVSRQYVGKTNNPKITKKYSKKNGG